MKKKLLRDVKQHPEEYEKVKELIKKQQKLKDEYPLIFIDKDVDIKKINIFRKAANTNLISSAAAEVKSLKSINLILLNFNLFNLISYFYFF